MIVVGIELRKLKEHHYAKPGRADVKIGDEVLVSTENGLEAAVVIEPEKIIQGKKVDMKVITMTGVFLMKMSSIQKKYFRMYKR